MTGLPAARLFGLLAVATALAGCGTAKPAGDRIRGDRLTIYWAGPLHGASSAAAAAALTGARIALAQARGRIGRYRIELEVLDDSTVKSGGWDPVKTTDNVHSALANPTTIGYLGDFNSGASAVSIPLLNRAGVAQVSSASSAVGLTSGGTGADPGEPQKYYPLGIRTFARVVPSDAVEAVVQVHLAESMGCTAMFVLEDGEVDGEDGALSFALTAKSAGLRVVGVQAFQRDAAGYAALAAGVARSGANCVLLSAIDELSAARLTAAVADALPSATIIASSGLADGAYTDPADGGIPVSIDRRVLITAPAPGTGSYPPSGRAFLAAYTRAFGTPAPAAILGYEAMGLMLSAISRATDHGRRPAERWAVVGALLHTRDRHSVLGAYSIEPDGDTTIRGYGVYTVSDGLLSLWRREQG